MNELPETDTHFLLLGPTLASPTYILRLVLAGCLSGDASCAYQLSDWANNEWHGVLQPPPPARFIAFIRSIKLFNRVLLRSKVNAMHVGGVDGGAGCQSMLIVDDYWRIIKPLKCLYFSTREGGGRATQAFAPLWSHHPASPSSSSSGWLLSRLWATKLWSSPLDSTYKFVYGFVLNLVSGGEL